MKDILLIKLGALGDVVRTTGLLRPLRSSRPGSRVWWVTEPSCAPLLKSQPGLHRVVPIRSRIPRSLARKSFDLLANLDEDPRACRWAGLLSARRRIGAYEGRDGRLKYTPESARYFRMGLLNRSPSGSLAGANDFKKSNTKTYQRLWAGILGLDLRRYPSGYELRFPLRAMDVRWARGFLERLGRASGMGRGPWVGVNPGAGRRWPSKQLSVAKSAEVLRALRDRGWRPLLLGGPEEGARNRSILRRAGAADAGTNHSLGRFAALLSRCGALVTTDSLALHLGCAVRVPCVALFGPTSASEIELYGRGVRLVPPGACKCYYRPRCSAARPCLDRLPVASVVKAVEKVLR